MESKLIQTLHPHPEKTNKKIALEKYNCIKENILRILGEAELTHTELMEELYKSVKSKQYWGYPVSWIENWRKELILSEVEFYKQNILVLENESKICGFCSIVENIEHYEILHLWLLPEFIGKGHGKKLLKASINAFVRNEKPIIVTADPNSEAFYVKHGFLTFDSIESFPKGRFLPVMKKTLRIR